MKEKYTYYYNELYNRYIAVSETQLYIIDIDNYTIHSMLDSNTDIMYYIDLLNASIKLDDIAEYNTLLSNCIVNLSIIHYSTKECDIFDISNTLLTDITSYFLND